MAIRGITGALMAGPMESPELTPFPFQAALNFQTAMDAKRTGAMEQQQQFQSALNQFGAIPGTEDIGDFYTKPYLDKANKIIDNYGGDMAAASSDLQNLYFDFSRNMTDDMRSQANAVTAYQTQQANLAKGVEENKFSSATAAALLNQQTMDYENALKSYGLGEGARPTGATFARRPVDTPDFQEDLNRIRDDIKPDTLSQAGYDIVTRPGDGKQVFVERVSKREFSFEEARELEATKALMADRNYIDYATEQYQLGLMGTPYNGEKYLDIAEKSTLPPLSLDPAERQQQILNAGVTDDAGYTAMRDQQKNQLISDYNNQINSLMESGLTREQADLMLGKSAHDNQQVLGILQGIAGGAAVGAYDKQTLQNVKFPDSDTPEITTEGVTAPRTSATPSVTIDTPKQTAESAEEKITGLQEDINLANAIVNDESQPDFRRDQAKEDIANYETSLQNERETLANAQFAQAFEAIGLGEGILDGNFSTLAEESEKFNEFVNDNISKLLGHYTDEAKIRADMPNAGREDVAALVKDMSGMGMDDADWDTKFKEYEEKAKSGDLIINGFKADNLLGVARDIRNQFNRLKEVEGITRSFNQFENLGENEQIRMDERTQQFISKELNILDPTKVGTDGLPVSVMDKLHSNMQTMETSLKAIQGYSQAIHAPKLTPTGDIVNGEPVFILDMAYYKPGPNQDAVPMPDDLLNTLIETDSSTARMLSNADQQRRFAVLLPDQNKPDSQLRGFIDDKIKLAQDLGRDPKERFSSAQTGVRMQLNLDYGSLIQKTGIETIPSEIFSEDQDNNTYGYVNRKVPTSLYKSVLNDDGTFRDQSGNVIIDTSAGEHMRIEKVTAPNNEVYYTLYPYKGENERGRDTESRLSGKGLSTSAASLEDLIFRAFGGNDLMGQIVPDLVQ